MNRLTATESLVSIQPDFSYITQDQNAVNNTFVQQLVSFQCAKK